MAEMNEKRDDSNRLIDGLICSDRSKGFLSIIRVDLFLSIDDTRYLSILDPSERNRYVSDGVYIVCRAPKRLASSVLLSIGPMHWLISWREKANVVSCLVVVRRLDTFPGIVPHRKKERAWSPGPTCKSANVKRGVEPELANRSHFRNHTSYS